MRANALGTAFFPHLTRQRFLFFSPLELTRQECKKRREKLLQMRDERALRLGQLLLLKPELEHSLNEEGPRGATLKLQHAVASDGSYTYQSSDIQDPIEALYNILFTQFTAHSASHSTLFASLRRPSRLTLLWPRLAIIPPALLISLRMIYNSRESIMDTALQAHDTVKGFWFGYVVDPVREILDTVRTGGEEGVRIINQQAVRADLEV